MPEADIIKSILGDRRGELDHLRLRAALNADQPYGHDEDGGIYQRADVENRVGAATLQQRGIIRTIAFYAESPDSPVRCGAVTADAEWMLKALLAVDGFATAQQSAAPSRRMTDEMMLQQVYRRAFERAAAYELPFLVVLGTADRERPDNPCYTEVVWLIGTSVAPLLAKVKSLPGQAALGS